jgi:2-C-methyl-D-erythritol 4-phosphate cytidylyltransferase
VKREDFVLVQTPQTFQLEEIRKAYNMHYTPSFTDDASVYEASGYQVTLVEGNKDNIKMTDPSDLAFMQWLKKQES